MTPPKRNGERNDAEPIADCRLRIQRQLPIGDWRLEIRSTRVPQSPIRNRQSPIEKSPIRNPQSKIPNGKEQADGTEETQAQQ